MVRTQSRSFGRRLALAAVPTAITIATLTLASPASVEAQQSTPPTPIGVVDAVDGLPECAPSELGSLPEGTEAAAVYAIAPEESIARYRVEEELADVGVQDAVGETQAMIGQIGFDENGMPLACSRFDVDMRTLQSDSARRDNYLYANTLEAETYPLATFVLRAVEGLDQPLAAGEETAVVLIGDLTLRDTTKLVAWQATVVRDGERLTGNAATEFEMPDFGIEPPRVPVVLSLDETIRLEIDIAAAAS